MLCDITRVHRETIIITRDIKNSFAQVREALKNFVSAEKRGAPEEAKEHELKKVDESLDKVEKYISKDIEKLE